MKQPKPPPTNLTQILPQEVKLWAWKLLSRGDLQDLEKELSPNPLLSLTGYSTHLLSSVSFALTLY